MVSLSTLDPISSEERVATSKVGLVFAYGRSSNRLTSSYPYLGLAIAGRHSGELLDDQDCDQYDRKI